MELKHVAKKAAKKSAKKAAKKAPAKHAAKHAAKQAGKQGKDTRRAYEHLGRVQSLAASMPAAGSEAARTLAAYDERSLRADAAKDAAELLRAAEHHLFATLAQAHPADESLAPELLAGLREEHTHLSERAAEHGGCSAAPPAIRSIYKAMQKDASAALRSGHYRAAMEFARGADALTHAAFAKTLPTPAKNRQIAA